MQGHVCKASGISAFMQFSFFPILSEDNPIKSSCHHPFSVFFTRDYIKGTNIAVLLCLSLILPKPHCNTGQSCTTQAFGSLKKCLLNNLLLSVCNGNSASFRIPTLISCSRMLAQIADGSSKVRRLPAYFVIGSEIKKKKKETFPNQTDSKGTGEETSVCGRVTLNKFSAEILSCYYSQLRRNLTHGREALVFQSHS